MTVYVLIGALGLGYGLLVGWLFGDVHGWDQGFAKAKELWGDSAEKWYQKAREFETALLEARATAREAPQARRRRP